MTSGGVEPPPVIGHLGGGEPIVKPTFSGRFFVFVKGGGSILKAKVNKHRSHYAPGRGAIRQS